jgi:autotransporter strand-loop-strand O-heptosyltransferase
MPWLERYQNDHDCKVFFWANMDFADLFAQSYPEIEFVAHEQGTWDRVIDVHYNFHKPVQQGMAEQLGYEKPEYLRPKIDSQAAERPIKNKYVAMGVHSTAQLKFWNHPAGKGKRTEATNWNELCHMLRKRDLTPVCIEKYELYGKEPFWNGLPKKAVKKVNLPLKEVINHIEHAEFYIGLSSGIAWIAHALGKPVAMIANFTEDWNEFDLNLTDYKRITNKAVCHGCWNNPENQFINTDWEWCPKHTGTVRQFECHTSITPEMVFNAIEEWI